MSKTVIAAVTCPHCGGTGRMEVWESINTTMSPEARERMLRGTLFSHRCQACGRSFQVLYECLYHDMERQFMAFFLPERPEDPFAMLERRVGEPILAGYQTRIVHDVPSLIEKVRMAGTTGPLSCANTFCAARWAARMAGRSCATCAPRRAGFNSIFGRKVRAAVLPRGRGFTGMSSPGRGTGSRLWGSAAGWTGAGRRL